MDVVLYKVLKSCIKMTASIALIGSLAACATASSPIHNGAPITYKIGQQNTTQYASLNARAIPRQTPRHLPRHSPRQPSSTPYTQPAPAIPYTPPAAISAPSPSQPIIVDNFDMASVDPNLYAHQIVGEPYRYKGKSYRPEHAPSYNEVGTSSWYGDKFHGKPTASTEIFNKNALTAAHRTLPLNSLLRVTNLETGKVVMVRLNDRGPFIGDRIIDLSEAAALQLGTYSNGLALVRVQYAGPADPSLSFGAKADEAPRSVEHAQPAPSETERLMAQVPQPLNNLDKDCHKKTGYIQASYRGVEEGCGGYTGSLQAPSPFASNTPEQQALAPSPAPNPNLGMSPEAFETEPAPEWDGNVEDGTVTLTIKGPIHMATHRSDLSTTDNRRSEPRVIPARHERRIQNSR